MYQSAVQWLVTVSYVCVACLSMQAGEKLFNASSIDGSLEKTLSKAGVSVIPGTLQVTGATNMGTQGTATLKPFATVVSPSPSPKFKGDVMAGECACTEKGRGQALCSVQPVSGTAS